MKKLLLLLGAFTLVFGLAACSNDDDGGRITDENPDLIQLTLEELAQYDGTNGNPAYIAVDGWIYDVTDDPNWVGGSHNGFLAGQDLTEQINAASPHGTAVLDGVPIIGELVEESVNLELTLEELAMYDGTGGNPAYIAVDGVIYDVTNDDAWSSGSHGGYTAGMDLTDFIDGSPHGASVLDGLPVVGSIIEDTTGNTDDTIYLTITELAMYDGMDGAMAYVAIDGIIYDVTDNSAWSGGSHAGLAAGLDLTQEIEEAGHGTSVLDGLTAVGELVIDASGDGPYDPYLYLTLADLAEYDGMDGAMAYVAVEGVVYDVTDNSAWSGGSHAGLAAGVDLTSEIMSAGHGDSVLDGLTIVGELLGWAPEEVVDTTIYLSIDQLAMYDGTAGNPAYVAVNGIIYDVTDNSAWSGGSHAGLAAGLDLTQEIAAAGHGTSVLDGLTAVGELVVDASGDGPYDPYLYLTLAELAMYDGQDGADAYVAVSGVIYDVTGVSAWTNGTHNGNMAGQDHTDTITGAPHGASVLDGLTVVGELLE